MQSSKPSKKTSKQANDAATAAQEITAAEVSKPRASRSSKPKKSEPAETGTVKHHHKTIPSVANEPVAVEVASQATPAVAEFAAVLADRQPANTAAPQVTHQQIAELAHSYWIARGCAHGSAEEDWLRAERELLEAR